MITAIIINAMVTMCFMFSPSYDPPVWYTTIDPVSDVDSEARVNVPSVVVQVIVELALLVYGVHEAKIVPFGTVMAPPVVASVKTYV